METKKAIMTLEEGRNQISNQNMSSVSLTGRDINVDIRNNRLALLFKDREFPIEKTFEKELKTTTGINAGFLNEVRDNTDLFRQCVSHSLNKRRDKEITIILCDNEIYDIFEGQRPWVNSLDLFDILVAKLGNKVVGLDGRAGIQATKNGRVFRFITNQTVNPAKNVNDLSHVGISISSNGHLELSAFCYRLACTNGMLRKEDNLAYSMLLDKNTNIAGVLENTLNKALVMAENFVRLDEKVEKDPASFLAGFAHNTRMPARTARVLLENIDEIPENPTRYDIANYITSRANEKNDTSFEQFGADCVDMYNNNYRWQKVPVDVEVGV